MSIEKNESSVESNGCNIKDLIGKDLSDLSNEELSYLNKFISSGYLLSLAEIDFIRDNIFQYGYILEEEVILLLVVSISGYYLDNNFHQQLEKLFFSLKVSVDVIVDKILDLKNKYKGTDRYCFLSKNIEGFLHYYYLSRKAILLEEDNTDDLVLMSEFKLGNSIKDLEELFLYVDDEYYFYYFNTLVSYANYELLFIENNDLKNKYFNIVQRHIDSFSLEYISKFTIVSQVVFLNNINFLRNDLKNIVKYEKLLKEISKENIDGLYSFTNFYSGIDITTNSNTIINYKNNKVSLYAFYSGCEKNYKLFVDKIAILDVLAETCPIKTIRKNAEILLDFLVRKNKDKYIENDKEIRGRIEKYKNEVYYTIYDDIRKSLGFNSKLINNKVKNFIIQYLGLEVNFSNLDFDIYVSFPLNDKLNIPFVKEIDEYKEGENSFTLGYFNEKSIGHFLLSIKLPSKISNKVIDGLDSHEVVHFLKLILDKVYEINSFLNQIDQKIDYLRQKDIETVNHMEKLGFIMREIIKATDNNDYKKKIDMIKEVFPLKDDVFFETLGYLHDIGKADRVDIINVHKNTNIRVEGYEVFSNFIVKILPKFKLGSENVDNKIKIAYIHSIISKNDKFVKKVKELFDDISTFNLKNVIESNYYINSIFSIVNDLHKLVKSELNSRGLSYKVFKGNYGEELASNLAEKYNVYVEEGDVFFLTLMLVLLELGKFQIKELTYPHIIHGLQFFQLNPKFSFLSSVLYHHDYPSQKEILSYNGKLGLDKINLILGESINYLEKGDESNINPDNKNLIMVLTTIADMIDALLGQRSYQTDYDFKMEILPYLNDDLINEITDVLYSEKFRDKSRQFDKSIFILNKIFSNNEHWNNLKKTVINLKENILSQYL